MCVSQLSAQAGKELAQPAAAVFDELVRRGADPARMFNTFNMGVGMIVSVDKNDADKAIAAIKAAGEDAYILGELVESEEGVIIC